VGVGSRFQRYRGRRVPFSWFALPDSFLSVPCASGLVFIFWVPRLIFDGTKGVGYRFHVLHYRTRFRRYRGRPIPFLCFSLPNSFLAVPRASYPVFIFSAPGYVFNGTEDVRSLFHILRFRNRFENFYSPLPMY
jgi:hypothetical protein